MLGRREFIKLLGVFGTLFGLPAEAAQKQTELILVSVDNSIIGMVDPVDFDESGFAKKIAFIKDKYISYDGRFEPAVQKLTEFEYRQFKEYKSYGFLDKQTTGYYQAFSRHSDEQCGHINFIICEKIGDDVYARSLRKLWINDYKKKYMDEGVLFLENVEFGLNKEKS